MRKIWYKTGAAISLTSLLLAGTANAATFTYTDTNSAPFDENNTCSGTFTRTFNVTDDFTINDLDVRFIAEHTWRNDIEVTVTAPDGTSVVVIDNVGGNTDNYNVLLSDGESALNDGNAHTAPDPTLANVNDRGPSNPLSAFNGLSSRDGSNGTWTLEICDTATQDEGVYYRSDLIFDGTVPGPAGDYADAPASYGDPFHTINSAVRLGANVTSENAGYNTVNADGDVDNGVIVPSFTPGGSDTFSISVNQTAANSAYLQGWVDWNGDGTFAASEQVASNVQYSGGTNGNINLSVTAPASATPGTTYARFRWSETPGLNATASATTGEVEDYLVTINSGGGGSGSIPTLTCAGSSTVSTLDWDDAAIVWNDSELTNSYTVDGEIIDFDITYTDPAEPFIAFSGTTDSPKETTSLTGGLAGTVGTLLIAANQDEADSTIDIEIDIGTTGRGVDKFQLSIFDVDLLSGQFQDLITVTGSLGGNSVTPVFTDGTANDPVTGGIQGNAASNNNEGNGNMTIRFNQAVDNVVITWGNGPEAMNGTGTDRPGNQWIGLHDILFCEPRYAELSGQKSAEIYDPLSEGLYAIPGNDVVYTITSTNSGNGPADADTIFLVDKLPDEVEFYNGDIDDGGPETNPISFSDNGTGLTLDYATDVAYSNGTTKPTDFSQCTYTPSAGYDPAVSFICINPSGIMASGDPDPSFSVSFRTRIE